MLIMPLYINLFQLDSHGPIDKLFPFTGSPESVDSVKHTVFL